MQSAQPSRLLIIDGHAYAYRAFHAIRQLSAPDGTATNAIYGFIKMTGKMRAFLNPTHLAVVWDGGLSEERVTAHPEYKSQRPPMPDQLESQIGQIVEYLQAAGLPSYCEEGIEADDWIASIARHSATVMPVVIASSDKDFMQLVAPSIGLLNPNDKTEKVWTREDVEAKTGVRPDQIVDWLSLIGDKVDNIPGIPGVGPKTATDLLRQFGSIDGIYDRLAELGSERLRAALSGARDAVFRNRQLIRLKESQPALGAEALELKPENVEQLRGLYARWGFRTLLASLAPPAPAQGALF